MAKKLSKAETAVLIELLERPIGKSESLPGNANIFTLLNLARARLIIFNCRWHLTNTGLQLAESLRVEPQQSFDLTV